MSLIKITPDNPEDLFRPPEFPTIKPGKHVFLVANELEVSQSSGDDPKDMVKLEARCQDDDENKGLMVFDIFLLIGQTFDEKSATAKKIHDAKLAQFVVACGATTAEKLTNGEEFDLADCNGKDFAAITAVRMAPVYPEELDDAGKPKKAPRSYIKQYLFDQGAA